MISNAKGRHVSPGVYTEEKDVIFSVKSLGITSLGLVGETLYGPAFENIEISEWNDFVDYFGGTSGELYKGTGLPKYELPYIAKSYLTKSKRLNVVKVLGFSGYDAGKCWVVKAEDKKDSSKKYPLIIIRGKKEMGEIGGDICSSKDSVTEIVSSITITEYNKDTSLTLCPNTTGTTVDLNVDKKLCIKVTKTDGTNEFYNVSLDSRDGDYIYKVISSSPQDNKTSSVYVEAVYENVLDETDEDGVSLNKIVFETITALESDDYADYRGKYRCALTPWLVSEATTFKKEGNSDPVLGEGEIEDNGENGSDDKPTGGNEPTSGGENTGGESGNNDCITCASVNRLFRFLTISDGDASNFQVKVSIEKIDPFNGTFDVVVRDFNDTDANINVLEKFSKCTMKKGDSSFIGYKIGTSDGLYGNNSKFITVELATDEDMGGSVPCGFLGYPSPTYETNYAPSIKYRTKYNPRLKERKQYFGISSVDTDILTFKGREFYEDDEMSPKYDNDGDIVISTALTYTNGFHMDSVFCTEDCIRIYLDGEETDKYAFDCVSNEKITSDKYAPRITNARFVNDAKYMNETIYKNEKLRKFTVCFYGGFDGWDINRESRTNTDDYNVNNYGTNENGYDKFIDAVNYKLPSYVNTSDYYAYLAGYKVLSNPQDVEINVFATPGIDWYNNTMLTKDAIEVIEDPEDGRGGDALYIMNAPYGITDIDELTMAFEDTEINSSYACTYAPWILFKDVVRNQYLYLPPTKDVVRNIAETDNTSFPWFAPAGTTRGVVVCEKAEYKTTLEDEDKLYENRINPIKTFGKDGVIVWGNKTAYDLESPLNRINVRRLMIRVKKLITSAAKHLIFEQYDDALEKQFRGLIEPILADVKSNRGIFDYRVVTEVTPETRDQHILPAKIMIKPTPALEYISITFVVYPESVAFEGEE